jgi:hypothetical protein
MRDPRYNNGPLQASGAWKLGEWLNFTTIHRTFGMPSTGPQTMECPASTCTNFCLTIHCRKAYGIAVAYWGRDIWLCDFLVRVTTICQISFCQKFLGDKTLKGCANLCDANGPEQACTRAREYCADDAKFYCRLCDSTNMCNNEFVEEGEIEIS